MRFGEKLRALRKEKGLTQAELAKLAGVGLKTITNYEKGSTYPRTAKFTAFLPGFSDAMQTICTTRAMTSSLWPDRNTAIAARRALNGC